MNLLELLKKFPNQEACIKHLELVRWDNEPTCPYCGSVTTYKKSNELRHTCKDCTYSFSVTIGTIFHNSHIDLQKWFILISLMMNAKKGLSACQASRDIGLRRATVWVMMHKIRKAMGGNDDKLLSGIIEMDETYIGGKPRKESKDKDDDGNYPTNKRGRGTKKECVVGMVERNGKVKAKHINKKELKGIDLRELVRKNVDTDNATLITDEYRAYSKMKSIIEHLSVNHSAKEYSRNDKQHGKIHTNTIEGFWALLKRGIIGQFHKVSAKYLHRYIDEFCFRYNKCQIENIFGALLSKCI